MTSSGEQGRRSCLIIGQTNAGKTLFLINFARFLGLRRLVMQPSQGQQWRSLRSAQGQSRSGTATAGSTPEARRYTVDEARSQLVAAEPHTTRQVQQVVFEFPHAKVRRRLSLMDTTGISDGIHPVRHLRQAMAVTLRTLMDVDVTLHIVDAAAIGQEPAAHRQVAEVDRQLADFAPLRTAYRLLANKMDLPWARSGLSQLRRELPDTDIIPVSAETGKGFREVRAFVWDAL